MHDLQGFGGRACVCHVLVIQRIAYSNTPVEVDVAKNLGHTRILLVNTGYVVYENSRDRDRDRLSHY